MDEIEAKKKHVHLEIRNSKQRELQRASETDEQREESLRIRLEKDRE